LKEYLAANPHLLGEGLELISMEYSFKSGDRVDILLKDSSEKPVTVEVEEGFQQGPDRYFGVWQAVKYKHLAAVERRLPCEQVRSVLAAPEIPDDVKMVCGRLSIDPREVTGP
jgi:RecB family endonuclease NucS